MADLGTDRQTTTRRHTTVRLSELTDHQFGELTELMAASQTDIIERGIDRIYQDEIYHARMDVLASIAKHHNYNDAFQLLDAITSGEIALMLLADEPRNAAIRRLRELAPEEHPTVREAFSDIANALEISIERELGDWYEDAGE